MITTKRNRFIFQTLFLLCLSFFAQSISSQIEWEWIVQGDGHPDFIGQSNTIHDIVQAQDEFIYITGNFQDTIVFENDTLISAGFADAFIAKYDVNDNLIWVKQIAGSGVTDCKSVIEDNNGNIVIGGYFQNDLQFDEVNYDLPGFSNLFMFWLDPDGNIIQDLKTNDSNFGEIIDMVPNSEGDIIITGNFYGFLNKDNVELNSIGGQNFFVIKVNPNGFFEWGIESLNGGNLAEGIDLDSEGSIYLCGSFEDGIVIDGITYNSLSFNHSTIVVKFSTDGASEWVYTISGFDETHGKGISINDFDEIGCIAEFRDIVYLGESDATITANLGYDGFFFLLDKEGQFEFVKTFGGLNDDIPEDIDDDEYGNFDITGKFGANCNFGDTIISSTGASNTFLMKINRDSLLWIETIAGTGVNTGQTVFSGQNEKIYLGGVLRNSIYFNEDTLNSVSGKDFYLTSISDYVDSSWVFPVNIPEFTKENDFSLYPNPSESSVHIDLPKGANSLEIYSMNGSVLKTSDIRPNSKEIIIHHNLSSGIYVLKITTNKSERILSSKLIVR